jgi:hypothetical protein
MTKEDHADPGQHRVGRADTQALAQGDHAPVVEDRPGHMGRAAHRKMDAVEQVVPADDQQPEGHLPPHREPQQGRQGQHGEPDGPDHLQVEDRRRKGEAPRKIDQRHFKGNHQQAALCQVGRRALPRRPLAAAMKPGPEPGQEDKHRCTEMAREPGEEQFRRRLADHHRVGHLPVQVEKLTDMIHQHQGHHQPAQGIDGADAMKPSDTMHASPV